MYARLILALLAIASTVASAGYDSPRRVDDFNLGWKFAEGAERGVEIAGFNDSDWESVRLPHDWAIRGPYDPQGEFRTGKLPWRGEAWYRKSFSLPASDAGKRVYLDFDGVMAMPTVYVNGKKAGGWDYGYVAFRVDITDHILAGKLLHHHYNSDAWWLTMWNLNILWGLAWPGMQDEMSTSMMEYAKNGGKLPRGPAAGVVIDSL